jgi:hypothetical protein
MVEEAGTLLRVEGYNGSKGEWWEQREAFASSKLSLLLLGGSHLSSGTCELAYVTAYVLDGAAALIHDRIVVTTDKRFTILEKMEVHPDSSRIWRLLDREWY